MIKHRDERGEAIAIVVVCLVIALTAALGWIFWQNVIDKKDDKESANAALVEEQAKSKAPVVDVDKVEDIKPDTDKSKQLTAPVSESYSGKRVKMGRVLSVKVPNGWKDVTVDSANSFIAFAGPNSLEKKLKYTASKSPAIAYSAVGGWGGLAESFTINGNYAPSKSELKGMSATSFTLDDGTKATKHIKVLKKSDEFQKDADEYRSYKYVIKKGEKSATIELNVYSNTTFNVGLAEQVVRSIQL